MNKEWSELNKALQTQLKKESTYTEGIATLFDLRKQLMNVLLSFYEELNREDFNAIPFINANGYHCKTIAYSQFRLSSVPQYNSCSDLICGPIP